MNDVFISYSRRDKVFTQKLFEALKAANRIVWADWDSIPAASDWDAEIKEGIEQAESVLFLLSPEWIKSNECRKELVHAVTMGKRLIPILYQMVDPNDVPPELAKINWVYMRDTDDFDKAFVTLCTAMDTDLEWVKTHTRIQVRAVEWDKKKRENSFVLRGKDLADGEKFVTEAAGKSPEPTALQGEYILASRKDAVRRQRITLMGVTIALVVSIALGIAAFIQRQAAVAAEATAVVERDHAVSAEATAVSAKSTAVAERDRADLNAKVSFARELTAETENNLNKDPERSLMLALQAVDVLQSADQPVLMSTYDSLRLAVQNSRIRYTLDAGATTIGSIAFSPDGKYIVSGSDDMTARVWEVATGREVARMTYKDRIFSVAFSPDGKYVASGSLDQTLDVWDAMTGKVISHMTHEDQVWGVDFSPNGKYLVSASEDKTARVWEVATGREVLRMNHKDKVHAATFSPDGRSIVTTSFDVHGRVQIWDSATGTLKSTFTGGMCQLSTHVVFSPDGKNIGTSGYCSGVDVTILKVDSPGKQYVGMGTELYQHEGATVHDFKFSPDGTMVASGGADFTVIAVDLRDQSIKFKLYDTSPVESLDFSSDSKYIATGNQMGQIKIWNAIPTGQDEIGNIDIQKGAIDTMNISPDGTQIATTTADVTVGTWNADIWSLVGGAPIQLIGHTAWIEDIAFSPDGKKVVTGSADCTVRTWDSVSGDQLLSLTDKQGCDDGTFQFLQASFSPDGKYVEGRKVSMTAIGGGRNNTTIFWDASTGKQEDNFSPDLCGDFSPDGSRMLCGAYILEFPSGKNLVKVGLEYYFNADFNPVVRVGLFSPDGKQALIGDDFGTVKLWDAASGKEIQAFLGHTSAIVDLAFSPDGTLIASVSMDRTAKIWDVASGALITTISPSAGPVNQIAFSPDGKMLALGNEDGVVRFYLVHFEDLLALAKTRVTRSFTLEECQTYLHIDQCPASP